MSKASTKAILADIKSFLEANENITKKDFLKAIGEAFDKNKVVKTKALKVKAKIVADGIEDKDFNPADTGEYLDAVGFNKMMERH